MNDSPHCLPPFFVSFIAEQKYGMEYSFGQFGSAVLTVFPPSLLLSMLLGLGVSVGWIVMMLWDHCSAATKA